MSFGTTERSAMDPEEIKRRAINFPPQSGAAEILNWSTVLLHERAKKDFPELEMLSSVHDSLSFQCLTELRGKAVDVIYEVMERPIPELDNVVLPIKLTVGKFWDDPDKITIEKGGIT